MAVVVVAIGCATVAEGQAVVRVRFGHLPHPTPTDSSSSPREIPLDVTWAGLGRVVTHVVSGTAVFPDLPLSLPGVRRSEIVNCEWETRLTELGLANQSW